MIYILIVAAIVAGEYFIKNYIDTKYQKGDSKDILGGKVTIQKNYNEGAMLNFMEKKKELVKTFSCVCLGLVLLLFAFLLPKKGNRLYKLAFALVLGGALSNVSDRVFRGHVVDYFSINSNKFKKLSNVVFNLADIAIFLGSILMFVLTVFSSIFQGSSDKTLK